ncbi:MAG: Asp-tRNA(Asn)/Glu-tRNA(Gln) amidotransferase subunit GatC [Oligoflexia bacterium]|nr:Asp-tRNA(Asn)/Glu-tRNA(Gln) amidotransferase subunit GatC [Oligoflexia bacterium]
MAVSEETIRKIAHLARLELTEKEVQTYSKQLTGILDYVSQLSKVDTTGVEPLVTATDMAVNFREDKVEPSLSPDDLLSNAPDRSGNLFKVPPVL